LDISETNPTDEGKPPETKTSARALSPYLLLFCPNFFPGLALLLDGLAANSSLTSLDISFNYEGAGGDAQKKVVNALCALAKGICPLEGIRST
jgi:hypothetical protein